MWTNSNILNSTQTNRNRMNECFPRHVNQSQKFNFIPLNAYESEQYYALDFALAGFVKSEISIKIEDQVLKIIATPAQTSNDVGNEGRILKLNLLQRNVKIPSDAISDSIQATLENGILKIKFSKNLELKKEINIK
ncbi:MAG: Hsp20/alpha crystallin family protein [Saprospiraceae bacterium]|jgi:HSP20 family molecular chaperone IbpA|nr:Hsp20/alpha crystallin family protein [Saprospiraceae bacterium]